VTHDDLARLHAAAFRVDRPWRAEEFSGLLDNRFTALVTHPHGFALIRTLAGESELLTLAVDPAHHREGIALSLLTQWMERLKGHASRAYLEVASDNYAAIALYQKCGFEPHSTRKAYYMRKNAPPADALLMERALTYGQMPD